MNSMSVCLWFDSQAEEAADYYVSVFPDSRIIDATRYGEGMPQPAGSVMTVRFSLDGMEITALNGGPLFSFSPAISLAVACETQAEVDRLWQALTDGGEESQCGWLIDRFGVSWQIIPAGLGELLGATDAAAAKRATDAMLQMRKLDIAALRRAFDGE